MSISKGSDLVLLLLAGFRSLADAAQAELAARGFDDVRPVNGFAIRAVEAGADTASELGRRLTISKQAAAKIIVGLQERGYLERGTDPHDGRRKRLQVTEHGYDMLQESEAIFDKLRARWAKQIGNAKLKDMEAHLSKLTGSEPLRFDTPGWVARGVGAS